MTEWFCVRSIHAIHDEDAVRWKLCHTAAFDFIHPPPKKK